MGTLYVVAAPAGDPDDLTRRALRILETVSLIVADDPGSARVILDHHGIATRTVPVLGDGRLDAAAPGAAALGAVAGSALARGDVAYFHPGPSPALSEAGYRLVRWALESQYPVVPAPGPSLPITALVLSGLPADSFVFLGELPQEAVTLGELLAAVSLETRTILAQATRTLLPALLADLHGTLGDRPLVLVGSSAAGARVLWRGRLGEQVASLDHAVTSGIHVLVIGGAPVATARWDEERLRSSIQSLRVAGLGAKEISQQLAGDSGWSRREVYRLAVELAREGATNGN